MPYNEHCHNDLLALNFVAMCPWPPDQVWHFVHIEHASIV